MSGEASPLGRACFRCGADAPFGLGWPGPAREVPAGRRGFIWHCGGADCAAAAEARRTAAMEGR